jgi:adenylate kinase family enzyme
VKRVVIIGTSCSGKSHLGRILARKYQVPHVELDDLYWLPGWQERPEKEFISFRFNLKKLVDRSILITGF